MIVSLWLALLAKRVFGAVTDGILQKSHESPLTIFPVSSTLSAASSASANASVPRIQPGNQAKKNSAAKARMEDMRCSHPIRSLG